jgi:hypothetical protein
MAMRTLPLPFFQDNGCLHVGSPGMRDPRCHNYVQPKNQGKESSVKVILAFALDKWYKQ